MNTAPSIRAGQLFVGYLNVPAVEIFFLLGCELVDLESPESDLAFCNGSVNLFGNVDDLAVQFVLVLYKIECGLRLNSEAHIHYLCGVSVACSKVDKSAFCDNIDSVAV